MELFEWLTDTTAGQFVFTMLVSMIPIIELRGGLPFGVALGLPYHLAFPAAVIGNLIPAPFIIVFIRRIFALMRRYMPRLNGVVDKLEAKAHLKGATMLKYQHIGLWLFVAIPLPGTGAWTGSLVAAFLDMRLKKALPAVVLGVITAGCIMLALTHVGINLFSGAIA
ncbi:MAG: small multidrug export protein [Ruminococcaceae bacterium]|nr:small multidrug export protein [Oscillospiraceae bacterium]